MKLILLLTTFCIVTAGLQGCANGTGGGYPSSNREVIASPAAKISAGSGAMHSGMSGGGY